jgi:hypothetical protein
MISKTLTFIFILFFSSVSFSQKTEEELLLKKWYFLDTNFYTGQNEVTFFTLHDNKDINTKNGKKGWLEIKNDGTYTIINFSQDEPDPLDPHQVIGIYYSIQEGNYTYEKYIICLGDVKYNIDIVDEKFLLLRMEKPE